MIYYVTHALCICQKQFYLTEALKWSVISWFLDAVHEICYLLTEQRWYDIYSGPHGGVAAWATLKIPCDNDDDDDDGGGGGRTVPGERHWRIPDMLVDGSPLQGSRHRAPWGTWQLASREQRSYKVGRRDVDSAPLARRCHNHLRWSSPRCWMRIATADHWQKQRISGSIH